jgi:hypothetical protein
VSSKGLPEQAVFTDFLDTSATNITGWQVISADELMSGYAPSLTWFA